MAQGDFVQNPSNLSLFFYQHVSVCCSYKRTKTMASTACSSGTCTSRVLLTGAVSWAGVGPGPLLGAELSTVVSTLQRMSRDPLCTSSPEARAPWSAERGSGIQDSVPAALASRGSDLCHPCQKVLYSLPVAALLPGYCPLGL